ncbi:MAG: hypothetical protein WDM84_07105 [Bauldia sp.]
MDVRLAEYSGKLRTDTRESVAHHFRIIPFNHYAIFHRAWMEAARLRTPQRDLALRARRSPHARRQVIVPAVEGPVKLEKPAATGRGAYQMNRMHCGVGA